VKKIKLDQSKLLGFKILQQTPKVGGKPDLVSNGSTLKGKIGEKLGTKPLPGPLGTKIGVKVGIKPFLKFGTTR
jgi:hypothetical protein